MPLILLELTRNKLQYSITYNQQRDKALGSIHQLLTEIHLSTNILVIFHRQ